jgi:putative SbcD/Mre11-related phosphoesterase
LLTPVQPYPALILRTRAHRTLVVADLHIGWEITLAQEGIHVPSQTSKMLRKLLELVDVSKPSSLLFLGDVKHTIAKVELEEWRDIPEFFEALTKKVSEITVILGNHDGNLEALLPENVKITPPTGLAEGNVGFLHGNAWPAQNLFACRTLVMGHVHPTVAFRDPLGFRTTAQVWVRAKLDGEKLAEAFLKSSGARAESRTDANGLRQQKNVTLKASELFIMPCFNEFLGGRPVNRSGRDRYSRSLDYLGPILRSRSVDFDNAETFLLDGTFLGTIDQLRGLS